MHTVNQETLDIIAANADSNRENRQVSKDSVQALKDCGFYKMIGPEKFPGISDIGQFRYIR